MNTVPGSNALLDSIVDAAEKGIFFDAESSSTPTIIPARLVRQALLGDGTCDPPRRPVAVRIRNARIEGCLNLHDACNSGQDALPPFEFERCSFILDQSERVDAGFSIDAGNARLSRMRLSACSIGDINLKYAHIAHSIELHRLNSQDRNEKDVGIKSTCRIDGKGLHLGGDLIIGESTLEVAARNNAYSKDNYIRYALDLPNARIEGDIFLSPGFIARGGIRLRSSRIEGILWAKGSKIECIDKMPSIMAQNMHCQGVFSLGGDIENPCKVTGCIDLMNAKIGTLDFTNLEASPRIDNSPLIVYAYNSEILGDVIFDSQNEHKIEGELLFVNCKIGGSFSLYAKEWNEKFRLRNFLVSLDISNARINGNLEVNHDFIRHINAKECQAMMSVKIDVTIHAEQGSGFYGENLDKVVILDGGKYQGDLILERIDLKLSSAFTPVISIEDALIERDFHLKKLKSTLIRIKKTKNVLAAATHLTFYPGWELIHAKFEEESDRHKNGRSAIISFLHEINDHEFERTRILNGDSILIHTMNSEIAWSEKKEEFLKCNQDEEALSYLLFFCNHIWGKDGAFRIVTEEAQLKRLLPAAHIPESAIAPKITRTDTGWNCTSIVHYGKEIFEANFRISRDGQVEMTDDKSLGESRAELVNYDAPHRLIATHNPIEWLELVRELPISSFQRLDEDDGVLMKIGNLIDMNLNLQRGNPNQGITHCKAKLNINGSRSSTLVLSGDTAISKDLETTSKGFEYSRIEGANSNPEKFHQVSIFASLNPAASKKTAHNLVDWLKGKLIKFKNLFADPNPKEEYRTLLEREKEWNASAYETLARVLRHAGEDDQAKRVTLMMLGKQLAESKERNFFNQIMHHFFQNGLFARKSIPAFFFTWLLGTISVNLINEQQLTFAGHTLYVPKLDRPALVIDSNYTVELPRNAGISTSAPISARKSAIDIQNAPSGETRCGDEITPSIYALDVMVPLLDLRQENKCTISSAPEAWVWRFLKAFYAIWGGVLTAMILLTLTGVIRKRVEA